MQRSIQSWVLFVFPPSAVELMANAGECPKSLRWGHGEALSESIVILLPEAGNEQHRGFWRSIMRLLASNRVLGEFWRTREVSLLLLGYPPHCGRARGPAVGVANERVLLLTFRGDGSCREGNAAKLCRAGQ